MVRSDSGDSPARRAVLVWPSPFVVRSKFRSSPTLGSSVPSAGGSLSRSSASHVLQLHSRASPWRPAALLRALETPRRHVNLWAPSRASSRRAHEPKPVFTMIRRGRNPSGPNDFRPPSRTDRPGDGNTECHARSRERDHRGSSAQHGLFLEVEVDQPKPEDAERSANAAHRRTGDAVERVTMNRSTSRSSSSCDSIALTPLAKPTEAGPDAETTTDRGPPTPPFARHSRGVRPSSNAPKRYRPEFATGSSGPEGLKTWA